MLQETVAESGAEVAVVTLITRRTARKTRQDLERVAGQAKPTAIVLVGPSFLRVWLQDARDAVTEFKLLTNRWASAFTRLSTAESSECVKQNGEVGLCLARDLRGLRASRKRS